MKFPLIAFPLLSAAIPYVGRNEQSLSQSIGSAQSSIGLRNDAADDGPAPRLKSMLSALDVMQDEYFDLFTGTWPDSIDWTAAVMGTQVSATLSSIVSSFSPVEDACTVALWWQNTIDKYFSHISFFYFGENSFGLRNQAYDDMLWVVLGWLENIKFSSMYSHRRPGLGSIQDGHQDNGWHGQQFSPMAAHRARIFYDLASVGWDESLCDGGMNWSPHLEPYKNAITNELYASASIAMYLYFPGDNNSAPFLGSVPPSTVAGQHDRQYLNNAIKAYDWLRTSHMTNPSGLYQDGFHIKNWHRFQNGTIDPGTGQCDVISTMVYTYNQGVILSASRGLWIATGAFPYLNDGHSLIESVIRATGWPDTDSKFWKGLGRGGILEEYCDHKGQCSQDGQTFKGIFFAHLSEFCRPLFDSEEEFISKHSPNFNRKAHKYHLSRCAAYGKWIELNAAAAEATLDERGRFGSWWTFDADFDEEELQKIAKRTQLAVGAVDRKNPKCEDGHAPMVPNGDINDRGRGRTVETQAGGLAVLRARWNWEIWF